MQSETRPAQELQASGATDIRRRRRSRGQALVEFGLVVPLFFALIFGIIEFSLIDFSISTMNFAAKDAARIGSLLGSTAPFPSSIPAACGGVPVGTLTDCFMINIAIFPRTTGLVTAKIAQIEVFKAGIDGNPVSPLTENVYDGQGNLISSVGWSSNSREQGLFDADYLGVRITYSYTYLTGFIAGAGTSLTLTAVSVQRIEPQDFGYHHQDGGSGIVRAPGVVAAQPPSTALAAQGSGSKAWSRQDKAGDAV